MKKPTCLVLGGGPAGLLATHAATQSGFEVSVSSMSLKPSPMYGAQYLHAEIPGIDCGDPVDVEYVLYGTAEGYARKLGYDSGVRTSVESLEESHKAWDIRRAYSHLRSLYPVSDFRIVSPQDIPNLCINYDQVISTIPAKSICTVPLGHEFKSVNIWAAKYEGMCPNNTVLCNGDQGLWYRVSNIFGHRTIEWPYITPPPGETAMLVAKPVSTTCDCWSNVLKVGRYGSWSKGKLASHAYFDTLKFLREVWE